MSARARLSREAEPSRNSRDRRVGDGYASRKHSETSRGRQDRRVQSNVDRAEQNFGWQEEFMRDIAGSLREIRQFMGNCATKDDLKVIKDDVKADVKIWQDSVEERVRQRLIKPDEAQASPVEAAASSPEEEALSVETELPDETEKIAPEETAADHVDETIAPTAKNVIRMPGLDQKAKAVYDTEEKSFDGDDESEVRWEESDYPAYEDDEHNIFSAYKGGKVVKPHLTSWPEYEPTEGEPTESESAEAREQATESALSVAAETEAAKATESQNNAEIAALREAIENLKGEMAGVKEEGEIFKAEINFWRESVEELKKGQAAFLTKDDMESVKENFMSLQTALEQRLTEFSKDLASLREVAENVRGVDGDYATKDDIAGLKSTIDNMQGDYQTMKSDSVIFKKNIEAIKDNFRYLDDNNKDRDKRLSRVIEERCEKLEGTLKQTQMFAGIVVFSVIAMFALYVFMNRG